MRYSDIGTYNGLGDYSLDNIRHYSTGSEYLVTFSGGTITTSPNVEFHFSIKNGSDYTTVGCNTTGSIASLASCVAGQILNPLDTIRISDTSFVVTATEFFMPTDAQISYDKVNDLKITIEEVDSPLRKQYAYHRYGKSRYELSNHLGNVQSVVSNRKVSTQDNRLCLNGLNESASSTYFAAGLSNELTMAGWIKTTDDSPGTSYAITYYDVNTYEKGMVLGIYHGNARAAGRNGTGSLYGLVGTTDITDNQWHHLAVTTDGTNWSLYVDGVKEDSLVSPSGNFTSSSMYEPFTIGKTQYDGGYFNGCVKEVSFWNAVRPDTTIANDYSRNREFSGSEKNLIGYWKVNETTGTTITDYSSGNHDLTVSTSTGWSTTTQEYLAADIISFTDYYPYGSRTPGRNWNSNVYRYGFNGMEGDPEMKGTGNHYTTFFRQYDPRLGRWFSTDPVMQAWMSPYMAMDGNPILYADPRGDEIRWGSVKRWARTHIKALFNKDYRKKLKAFKAHWNEKYKNTKKDKFILDFDPNLGEGAIDFKMAQLETWEITRVKLKINIGFISKETLNTNPLFIECQ
ncbi:LamG-like jellyroll fold domain-containing protein [Salibacter halophilus]|uniref:LamG-like jellyroll fold domain-containing protein n=1 Tax=Salibacter halophilus TaxID=1803916 RepID=A0A6N6M5J6_9FLAO|nr:LamG-like jellyroll fold domain-containing protein [Salibacter halophilus]KAB1064897.1 hypothetical protein F3059_05965 [Salibacter halophilus]